ncbi:lactonase family protein [Actinomadura kijaniata]|uniref:lactonase family protein n=1 Tax=Actinomadura kijaniata TaxID=46161 RepID=UPI000829DA55|nr:lactonase family protein [Actinomadura kijaniata]
MDERRFWVGTYTGAMGPGEGVYLVRRGPDGALRDPVLAARATSPSYLAPHPELEVLYAVGEDAEGSVTAFAVEDGARLRPLGSRAVPADPCHLAVSPDGATLLVASYTAGTVAALRLDAAGAFTGDPALFRGSGGGPRADRQEGPHAHAVAWAPDGTVLSVDLGADLVRAFRRTPGGLEPVAEIPVPAGYGPRHLVVRPGGHVYLLTELEPRVLVLTPGDSYADLKVTAESPATAGDPGSGSLCAAIRLGGDGRFVYTSTRGADVVTTHRVLDGGARLEPVADVPTGASWPRDFVLDGPWLHVAHQHAGDVRTFRLDEQTGVPAPVGGTVAVPAPVCLLPAS